MDHRIAGAALPRVRVFDMGQLPRSSGQAPPALAPPVLEALRERLERGEQSLVFLNRRGYAPVLHCLDCGWKSDCPNCSAWRVFHKFDRTLRCHHCGLSERVPRACPSCGNLDIQPIGRGTERLAEQLAQELPTARIARIDADAARGKGALEGALAAMHAGDVDILVGTQMVTKGHDFRRVTLVAAVNPDSALFASDFRAAERQFALLMQAAGRAGRDAEQGGDAARCGCRPGTRATRCSPRCARTTTRRSPNNCWPSAVAPACRRSRTWPCCAPRRATAAWRRHSCAPRRRSRRR